MRLPRCMTSPSGYGRNGRELNGWGFTTLMVAGMLVVISLVVAAAYVGTRASCAQLGSQTGHPTSYHFLSGCYVDLPGLGWVPRDQWRNVNIAPTKTSRG